ncbi:MAG: hypothetical protein U5L95_00120 [Candidatus Saccharibacteria bacterium]|nr:hypothetical protein [Candidatus Saccharibacteria bacterium]
MARPNTNSHQLLTWEHYFYGEMRSQTCYPARVFTDVDDVLKTPKSGRSQNRSFRWFIVESLGELLSEISPIDGLHRNQIINPLQRLPLEEPKVSEGDARESDVSYDAPLKATVELTNKVTGEVKEQEIYLGDYPWMTERGTFVINGSERVGGIPS